jgi:hypothetical protein
MVEKKVEQWNHRLVELMAEMKVVAMVATKAEKTVVRRVVRKVG